MNHVFISHSHEESDFAENLGNRLKQAGFTVWRSVDISGGDDWRRKIDEAIKGAFVLIVIMTPQAKASEYVTYEWAFAWGAGVKVIPVMLNETELHPRLESLHHLDFKNRARPWNELIDEVSKSHMGAAAEPQKIDGENKEERSAYKRMIEALQADAWKWRSIERLAIIGGVSEEEALTILRRDSNVVFGKGKKSGRRIARLKTQ